MTGELIRQGAALPDYVRDRADIWIGRLLQIILIVVVALVARLLLHRAIDRLTKPTRLGKVPRILSPLKEKAASAGARLEGSLLLSERRRQRADTIASVLKNAVSLTIFVIAGLTILSVFEINLGPVLAGTSIVGVAVAFGAQNIVKDFLSGIFMILEDQYGVGDVIDVKEATGTVETVGLRTTSLRDEFGTVWYVRNGEIIRVGNKSQGFGRVVLDVPIAPDADLDQASTAMLEEAVRMQTDPDWSEVFLSDPELQGVQALTREETVIRLAARVQPGEQFQAARELRRRIRDRFEDLHIEAQIDTGDGPAMEPSDQPPNNS